jgi:hypothetical protein
MFCSTTLAGLGGTLLVGVALACSPTVDTSQNGPPTSTSSGVGGLGGGAGDGAAGASSTSGTGGSGGSSTSSTSSGTAGQGGGEPNPMPDFSLLDVNETSSSYNTYVSPTDYLGQVSAWYFGSAL